MLPSSWVLGGKRVGDPGPNREKQPPVQVASEAAWSWAAWLPSTASAPGGEASGVPVRKEDTGSGRTPAAEREAPPGSGLGEEEATCGSSRRVVCGTPVAAGLDRASRDPGEAGVLAAEAARHD